MKSMRTTKSLIALAVGVCLAGPVMAQSTTGGLFGKVPPGTEVVVTGSNGITRTVTAGPDGRYNVGNLPAGDYSVEAKGLGKREATVTIGGGTDISFSKTLETVVVTGRRFASLDTSQVDTRTVFTADTLSKIAVGQSINSVAMLAPGVVNSNGYNVPSTASNMNNPLGRASSANIGSFGGSAASENAFYVNGFPVTNPLTNIGATSLPFNAIGQVQVLTGGYGAEYGRSTGGVVNIVTKRGTNEWKGGAYTILTPAAFKSVPVNPYYPNTGKYNATTHYDAKTSTWTDGTLYQLREQNATTNVTYGAYAGGPIIRDRLFIFANVEQNRDDADSVRMTRVQSLTASNAAQGWKESINTYPRAALKVDWNITDNHQFELTAIQDNAKEKYAYYGFNYATGAHDSTKFNGDHVLSDTSRLYVAKYTGNLTDKLSISVLAGQQKIKHNPDPLPGYDASKNYVSISPTTVPAAFGGISNTAQPYSTVYEPSKDETTGYRLDLTYLLGKHELRVGYDYFKAKSYLANKASGPDQFSWVYGQQTPANVDIDSALGIGSPASVGGTYGSDGYYVEQRFSANGGKQSTVQKAWYAEDRWQVTDNVLLSLGFRNDSFTNFNNDGIAFVTQKNNRGPRLGAVWDVNGNATLKVFGNAGRYFLAMPNNVAVRQANASLNASKYFTYDGINADGTPNGLHQIAPGADAHGVCTSGPWTGAVSTNGECSNAPDPATATIVGLKPHYQDEFILGMEQKLTKEWVWGAKGTYRDLKSAIDDVCVHNQCRIFNPGQAATFKIPDGNGGYTEEKFSKEQMGFPKLKRRYVALDFFAEYQGPVLYGKLEYTWSRNYGNAEGQLNSSNDTGAGGQADVGVTSDWDNTFLMEGANGPLPNNRTHQIKVFGSYKLNPEWAIGGSAIVQSGRPRSCFSYYPYADPNSYDDPRYNHYCGVPGAQTSSQTPVQTDPGYVFSPRGSMGTTPWTKTFNVSVTFTPSQLKGLTLQADVLNVFDSQTPTAYYEASANLRSTANASYGRALYFTDPRSVRLTARYDF